MSEFKEQLNELLIDGNDNQINYKNFSNSIHNWPEISFYDSEKEEMHYESLGTDNCEITDIGEDYIELVSCNDYQDPHLVRIEDHGGELTVIYFEPHDFIVGLDFEEILDLLK